MPRARSTSHSVAAHGGCTIIPLAVVRAQEDETILEDGFSGSSGSLGTACPLSGRISTYRPVQISGASSGFLLGRFVAAPMIDREHDLPITRQAKVLRISRGSVYYLPRPVSASDLEVMRPLDRNRLIFPSAKYGRDLLPIIPST